MLSIVLEEKEEFGSYHNKVVSLKEKKIRNQGWIGFLFLYFNPILPQNFKVNI
jgi:hypothetical protein